MRLCVMCVRYKSLKSDVAPRRSFRLNSDSRNRIMYARGEAYDVQEAFLHGFYLSRVRPER